MNALLTGFRGTSSELLVKNADCEILILPNDKIIDSQILLKEIIYRRYDYILSFGQKPSIKDKVYIENTARNGNSTIGTNFEYGGLKAAFESENIPVRISNNAGTSFCNTLYWNGLSYIKSQNLDSRMIFIHIPYIKNITSPNTFFGRILTVIESAFQN